MVDLVKIRKKSREQRQRGEEAAVAASAAVTAAATAAVTAPAAPAEPVRAAVVPAGPPARPAAALTRAAATAAVVAAPAAAAPEAGEADDTPRQHLSFVLSREEYIIPIERIVEIIPFRKPTRVPNAEDDLLGILSLRGTIVTLLDLRRKLGHPQLPVTEATRIVVVENGRETVGLLVDGVDRVVRVRSSEVEPPPAIVAGIELELVLGVVEQRGRLLILLDLERVLRY